MSMMKESDLLRLSMILENQGNTTRNKYICKLAECVIFDSEKEELTATEICTQIQSRFQLVFDVLEIQSALKSKGKGRVSLNGNKYKIDAKVANQLSTVVSFEEKLINYIATYINQKNVKDDKDYLLSLIQKHLYYCFNSNAKNFTSIIGCISNKHIDETIINEYKLSPDETQKINDFLAWDNEGKDELFYNIVASCYEYCLITANKNPSISKSIFRGKKFFLDTNIIFRMAGINKDERQMVIKTFVDKCNEVGISLCYTSYVLEELYRVIDKEIEFIRKSITNGQPPIDDKIIGSISSNYEPNDFYVIYYNWCKEPQNKYYDFLSFRNYLCNAIDTAVSEFEYINAPNYNLSNKTRFTELVNSLRTYKTEKRTYRRTTTESVKTDINQVLHLESIRPNHAKNLWEMNEYLVSADQLFVSWSNSQFTGIPVVVIPSLWLSLILKVSGRASGDDYKSFCMFMTLRQHHSEEDKININPLELLARISEKTIDIQLKENIIREIISNRSTYSFDTNEDYTASVDKAFDVVLSKEKDAVREELEKEALEEKKKNQALYDEYEKRLAQTKTSEEYSRDLADKLAKRKVEWFEEHENVLIFIRVIIGVAVLIPIVLACLNIGPFRNLAIALFNEGKISDKVFSVLFYVFQISLAYLIKLVSDFWKYMASEKRRNKLFKKYFKNNTNIINEK